MKYSWSILLSVATLLSFRGFSQEKALSGFKKKDLTTTDLQTFYSYYTQDGNHAAVTGGKGSEKLVVYGVGSNLDITKKNDHHILANVQVDIISSASTDKIDFVMSSASRHDGHVSTQIGYKYEGKGKFSWGGKYLFGIESDYFSNGFNIHAIFSNADRSRDMTIVSELFFDDLRWGRLNSSQDYKPTTLIYPSELRYKKWFTVHHRHSYTSSISFRQDLTINSTIQVEAGITYQEGLLSTPFHRVYFRDSDSVKVEKLPGIKTSIPLSIRYHKFLSNRLILKSGYRFYQDNFGVKAHTLTLEVPVKINQFKSLIPFARMHYQSASTYFSPFQEHNLSDTYYTSDYDLSERWTFSTGLGASFSPQEKINEDECIFQRFVVRYSYFWRNDSLHGHTISTGFGVKKNRSSKKQYEDTRLN